MTTAQDMRIGDAAAALGIEAHVLRHWESVGLLNPPRSPSGHRSYDPNTLDVARIIRLLQRAGLSLDQIRQLGLSSCDDRRGLINDKRADIERQLELLRTTDRFLEHLTECSHPIIAECPDCSEFTRAERGFRHSPLSGRASG
ncbi:MerR family transcriptional regulator [Nocardia sp. NBC_01503]|uniref:MerR family transcriptional regulator n=1 Tax=Nocardia sp. NBC_01503 TaxID=2975997 RepID=UPI002E7ADD6C|nr:MerR family transcriptional regulator [Nocardia sp. NBC_01503]WTL31173.1 MerR family transcriptional regulator [Nocardia sp. NBC_01503]